MEVECKYTTNQWNHQTKRQKRCVFLDVKEKRKPLGRYGLRGIMYVSMDIMQKPCPFC